MFQLNASRLKHSVETSTRFSDLKAGIDQRTLFFHSSRSHL